MVVDAAWITSVVKDDTTGVPGICLFQAGLMLCSCVTGSGPLRGRSVFMTLVS